MAYDKPVSIACIDGSEVNFYFQGRGQAAGAPSKSLLKKPWYNYSNSTRRGFGHRWPREAPYGLERLGTMLGVEFNLGVRLNVTHEIVGVIKELTGFILLSSLIFWLRT